VVAADAVAGSAAVENGLAPVSVLPLWQAEASTTSAANKGMNLRTSGSERLAGPRQDTERPTIW